ncbi:hypothetical protein CDV36_015736 [Fusarium kuroshium]|uniref:Uncharacterized protein n=1 Tax=Fusarium kuroshium TaxID=2010991 RepID=A0A3M2R8L9_9HYPO|nr:hypothetical protein CDV36_015736 [Fusarium kuroshium]
MNDDRGVVPDPRDPESLVRIIDPTPFRTLCGRVDLLALSTTVNSLRALPFTAHPKSQDVVQDLGKDKQSQRVWAWAVGAGTLVVSRVKAAERDRRH